METPPHPSPETPPEAVSPTPPKPNPLKQVGLGALLLLGLSKFWGAFKLIAFGVLKFGKVLPTALSMVLTVGVYAVLYPLPFAVGFVALIFIHEMGHILVLMRYGLKASAPVFIPFVGAMIAMKEMPKNVQMEALVAYGGPFAGTLAAFACYGAAMATGQEFWLALAHVGFFLNLFNLTPLTPLDGGRITAAISRWLWVVGWFLILGFFLVGFQHPILVLLLIIGGIRVWQTLFRKQEAEAVPPDYYSVRPPVRWAIGCAYFVLVFVLSWMSLYTDALLARLR